MAIRWLIVEDALRDRKGHWFEYLITFWRDLRELGDEVTVLADRKAKPFIIEHFKAHPVLPESIWHRMGDGASSLHRYLRVPVHAFLTRCSIAKWLKHNKAPDVMFVPTVLVHHLLGWAWLIKTTLRQSITTVLLFFPNLPIQLVPDGTPVWSLSPTTKLMRRLFQWMSPEIKSGKVILGVETHAMRDALMALTGLPVTYFPHPVAISISPTKQKRSDDILMACYGAARSEKGSDLLQAAIAQFLKRFPDTSLRFAFQWVEDFQNETGETVSVSTAVQSHDRVEIIDHYFDDGEYQEWLAKTDVMLLPYRRSSYGLRVSRVTIEALTSGIPVIATYGTTLVSQAEKFGVVTCCEDEKLESLVEAMRETELHFREFSYFAISRMEEAQEHFSVRHFREIIATCARLIVDKV